MSREKNLKSFNTLDDSKLRKIASKGGKASAKARRKKADLKKAMEIILKSDVASDQARETLEKLGYEPTNEMLIAFQMFQQAANGNVRAFEALSKLTNTKDEYDIAEQKARTKLINQQVKQAESELKTTESQEDKLAQLFDIVDGEINESK